MMKTIIYILSLVLFLLIFIGCNKDNDKLSCQIRLVNKEGTEVGSFNPGDSVYFKFYLTNPSDKDVYCISPLGDILTYLKVYKEISDNKYEYIGNPIIVAPNIYFSIRVKANSTTLLDFVQVDTVHWPKMDAGNYYVGDTLKLLIDSTNFESISRKYFSIK